MDDLERPDGISRRGMIKRIGAGAAIVWAAPVLTSLRMPAFAQTTSGPCAPTCTTCFACDSAVCSGTDCFSGFTCLCSVTTEGDCFCAQNQFGSGDCTSSAQCQPGERCMNIAAYGCAGTTCLPACSGSAGQGNGPLPAQAP